MASGPQHYMKAETLVDHASAYMKAIEEASDGILPLHVAQGMAGQVQAAAALAQVHATLALAAASAQNIRRNGQISPHATGLNEWNAVLGTEKGSG